MEELYKNVKSILDDHIYIKTGAEQVLIDEYEKTGDLDSAILKVLQTVQKIVVQAIQDDEDIEDYIPYSDSLGELISKLSSDDLKIEQMKKFYKLSQEAGYDIVDFVEAIKGLSTDDLKIEMMHELEDSLEHSYYKDAGKLEVVLSLDDIELIIEQLNTIRIEPIADEDLAEIITERCSKPNSAFSRFYAIIKNQPDDIKIRFMDTWNSAVPCSFWNGEWISADMIKYIEDDTLKEQQIRRTITESEVQHETWCLALPTIEDDEVKAKLIKDIVKAWGDKDNKENLDEDILTAIDSISDRKIKERLLTSYLDEIRSSFDNDYDYKKYMEDYALTFLHNTAVGGRRGEQEGGDER